MKNVYAEVNSKRFSVALREGVLPKDENGKYHFTSASFDSEVLAADPASELSYIVAPPAASWTWCRNYTIELSIKT